MICLLWHPAATIRRPFLWDGSSTLIASSANGASPESESVVMGLRKEGLMSSSSGGAVPGALRGGRWGSKLWSWYFLYELFIGTTCRILAVSPSLPPSTAMLSHPDITLMCCMKHAKANGALGHYVGKLFCPLFSSNMRSYGIRNISLYYSMDTSNNDIRKQHDPGYGLDLISIMSVA